MTGKLAPTLAILLIAGSTMSGCGRAGAPLKPSEAEIQRAKAENRKPPEAPIPNRKNPDKRFILDGLLE